MEGVSGIPAQLGRKEWRVVTESSRVFVEGRNINNNSRLFPSGGSGHSSDSDHLISESGPPNLITGLGSPRQNTSHADDGTVYEVKHVQQANGQLDVDLGSVSIDSSLSNHEDPMQQRLRDITRQREQLQQLEIDLRAQFIARAEVVQIQNGFDEQVKQHAGIVANLQEQLQERDHHIHDLEQQLEERQRQLRANQIETNEAVSQVWAKDGLLREQNNELATLRRECDSAMSEQKAIVAQLDAERAQHLAQIQDLKEQLREKENQIQEMEEQRRTAQDVILYKDEQLRDAQAWAVRIQDLEAFYLNSSHSLQVELRDRTDQFNQLWLGCQRQLADVERHYLQTIQRLQLELAEVREQNQVFKDSAGLDETDTKDEKQPYSQSKGGNQSDVDGEALSKAGKHASTTALNNQAKVGVPSNGSVDGAMPVILLRDLPAKVEHAAGLPIAPSPVFGMGAILPSGPMAMMHQFGMHQQGVSQIIQPSSVQVPQTPHGQFQPISAIVPPQQLVTPLQHKQPIQQNHQYLHQHPPSQVQRLPSRQQSHSNYQVSLKSQVLHSKHQELQPHTQQDQTVDDIVGIQREQQILQAQKPKEEEQNQNLSSHLQQECDENNSQLEDASGRQQPEQTCQKESQGMPMHLHFQPSEQNRSLDQQQLPSFSQHKIKIQQSKAELGVQDMEFESQHLTHCQSNSINIEQIGPVSRTSVSASPSQPFGGSGHFQQGMRDYKAVSDTSDLQSSESQSEKNSGTPDGFCKASEPTLLDERSLLACFVRAIPAEASARIRISTTLPNRLGKMLAPLHWHDYKKQYGRLDEFVTSHPELFVIEGDFIHLKEGAHATISATNAVAKVAAAAAAAASPVGSTWLPTVAVTPVAQSQVHRTRKGMVINPKDVKGTSLNASPMVQMVSTPGDQYTHLQGGMLKQTEGLVFVTSVENGSISQSQEVTHTGIEDSSKNSKGDCIQADGVTLSPRLDGLTINSNSGIGGNFDKAIANGYKTIGTSNGRIGMPFGNRQGRATRSRSYVKQEFVHRPQTQESRITRIDAPST